MWRLIPCLVDIHDPPCCPARLMALQLIMGATGPARAVRRAALVYEGGAGGGGGGGAGGAGPEGGDGGGGSVCE